MNLFSHTRWPQISQMLSVPHTHCCPVTTTLTSPCLTSDPYPASFFKMATSGKPSSSSHLLRALQHGTSHAAVYTLITLFICRPHKTESFLGQNNLSSTFVFPAQCRAQRSPSINVRYVSGWIDSLKNEPVNEKMNEYST